MSITFVALETDVVRSLQAGGPDANGQLPERHVSNGGGVPCRHCLAQVKEGESYLILAHRPFPAPQPYAEQGPIFLHAEPCERYAAGSLLPTMLQSPRYIVRGYDAADRIVYGTGDVVPTAAIPQAAERLFANERVAYVHVRSASNNCYQCRIDRM
jgi:hypothetical protein